MTRRDIIIVAVLANIAVLAILFMLSFRTEEEKVAEHPEIVYSIEEMKNDPIKTTELSALKAMPLDEVDAVLEDLSAAPIAPANPQEDDSFHFIEPEPVAAAIEKTPEHAPILVQDSSQHTVEVTVKRGDALEKIARSNGTTVQAIMKANNIKSDRLKIGQVLRIPVNTAKKPSGQIAETKPKPQAPARSASQQPGDAEYYTIKPGDNPWKIAKQFRMKVDELLQVNNLDEEKARNLKVGDKIRVR